MNRKRGFGDAIRWNAIGSVARAAAAFVVQICLMRLLGPQVVGQFAIYLLIVGFGTIVSDGGVGAALVRSPQFNQRTLSAGLSLILAYSLFMAVAIVILHVPIMRLLGISLENEMLVVVAAATIVPLTLASVPMSVLRREYRSREMQIIQLSSYLIGFVCIGIPTALIFPSVWAMVAAFFAQTLVVLGSTWVVTRCPVIPTLGGARSLLGYGSRGVFVNLTQFVNESIDNAFVSHYLGARSLGLYSMAFNLGRSPTDAISSVLQSPMLVSSAHEQDHSKAAARRYIEVLNVSICLFLPIYLFVVLFPRILVDTLLGGIWVDAVPVLQIMGAVMALRLLGSVSGAVLWGRNRLGLDFVAQISGVAIFCLGFWGFPIQTVHEAALVTLAAYSVRCCILLRFALTSAWVDELSLSKSILLPLSLSAMVLVPVVAANYVLGDFHSVSRFCILAVVFSVSYGLRLMFEATRSDFAWQKRVAVLVGRTAEG